MLQEKEPPGIPWAAVATNGTLRFTIGEGPNDDRYIRRFVPETGFPEAHKIACPEFTGSYLSYDGENIYLSQWYKHRILKLDAKGNIVRAINVGAEISGHVFVDGMIYVLRGTEQNGEAGPSRDSTRERKSRSYGHRECPIRMSLVNVRWLELLVESSRGE